jgi:hypothetical protein
VSATPLSQPGAPRDVTLSVNSTTGLTLAWKRPLATGGTTTPLHYLLEWYTAEGVPEQQTVTSSADPGIQEVQVVTTRAASLGISGGFVLCFQVGREEACDHG